MRPKKPETTGSNDLFRARLDQIINMKHELVVLAGKIDWDWLDGEIAMTYQRRRDVLVKGLRESGWLVDIPKASMYVWAKIPDAYREQGSLEFTKKLIAQAKVSVSPGIGFGEFGDGHVRFAMIENESRTRQAIRGIKQMFRDDGLL